MTNNRYLSLIKDSNLKDRFNKYKNISYLNIIFHFHMKPIWTCITRTGIGREEFQTSNSNEIRFVKKPILEVDHMSDVGPRKLSTERKPRVQPV